MDNWVGYIMLACIASLTVFLGWILIIGICIIGDFLGVY